MAQHGGKSGRWEHEVAGHSAVQSGSREMNGGAHWTFLSLFLLLCSPGTPSTLRVDLSAIVNLWTPFTDMSHRTIALR